MASVKVAVRVRPFNQRERDMNAKLIVQMEGKKTKLLTVKNSKEQIEAGREKYKDFTFDHSYWSYDSGDAQYASQEQVFSDLGLDVIDSAFEGYNACVFAYGQTGSGKTFTMMGSPDSQGLIPRICRQLFSRVAAGKESGASYRTEVSYLEIYNERVKDLLATDVGHSLRVREHPKLGPYVQDLSKHLVSDYDDIQECMHRGNLQRTTASTQMNDVSSRSHAIFTITFVQASYLRHNNMPSETVSKVHLVDLAGSERADATGATGQRLVEGAHINKSLVTLGSVISALAEAAHAAPDGRSNVKKKVFIPYRDSVLTWLLKDSLGGNSKTIMIAAISPADVNYGETLSTLRYANRAKNIINKPTINEDPNVKLIRELREEIDNLRKQISYNTDPVETEADVLATLQRKEAQEKVLTEKWTEKWRETQQILHEQKALGLRKSGLGVVLDSDMPHLVGIDDNLLSTGVTLYHLKEGETVIGSAEHSPTPDIVLSGAGVLPLHCRVTLRDGIATIGPAPAAQCWLNTVLLDRPAKLSQGCILLLGRTNMFRYNDPAEAAKLREGGAPVNLSRLSLLSWSATDLAASTENLNSTVSDLESENRCERIEAQRAELERERRQFELQQRERQRRWHAEREQLQLAQRRLDEERSAMEREYTAACRRLSGEWRSLERGWALRRRALRCRQRDLAARAAGHAAAADKHARAIEREEPELAELQERLEEQRRSNEEFVRNEIKELVERGRIEQSAVPSPDESDELLRLLRRSAPALGEALDRQAGAAVALEREAAAREATLAEHRTRLARLTGDLALLAATRRGLQAALAEGGETHASRSSRHFNGGSTRPVPSKGPEPPPAAVQRSRSELSLRAREEPDETSADETGRLRNDRLCLSLSLDPLPSPNCLTPDTFHTATSSPGDAPWPTPSTEASTLPGDLVSSTKISPRGSPPPVSPPIPRFRLGPTADDSDDTSSTEDYHKPRVVEGQSSSSVERSSEDRQRNKPRRRINDGKNRRQVTEAEALRAMQRLCARIASQKMLVISSLENDCSKEELNRQIAVLQELQKKYVRLEMALQYSFFDGQPKRTIMVTPIQETPSLTLSESDMQVATEPATTATAATTKQRLKEVEIEASDNVSTSNDEFPETTWSDPLRAVSHRRDRNNDHDHDHEHDHGERRRDLDRDQYGRNRNRRRSVQSIPLAVSDYSREGLRHPIDFSEVVSVSGWVTRGAGARTHHEYEVRVRLPAAAWALLRRYRRFRDLYLASRALYGDRVAAIPFPARALWSSEALARARRAQLETFLRRLLAVCSAERRCPLHAAPLTGESLVAFSPFFRKGVFESGKCGTG